MTIRTAPLHPASASRASCGPARRAWHRVGWWLLGTLVAMGVGVRADAADAAGAAPAASSLLDRPMSFHARQLRRAYLAFLMQMFIRPEDGECVMSLRGDPHYDTTMIDVSADHETLREVLDRICAQAGWGWHAAGSTIVLDCPLPTPVRAALDRRLGQALRADDLTELTLLADQLSASSDLVANELLLEHLADAHLDHGPPALVTAEQEILLTALGANPPDLLQALPRRLPLCVASQDPRAVAGLAAAWRRACAGQAPVTPLLCALVGIMRYAPALSDLRRLAQSPQSVARDLDPHGPIEAVALANLRRYAIWSLGQLQDRSALDLILPGLAHPDQSTIVMCLDALEALRDPSTADAVLALDAGGNRLFQAEQYLVLAAIAPQRLSELLPPRRTLPSGEGGALPRGWLFQGIPRHPTRLILSLLDQQASDPADDFAYGVLRTLFPRLDPADQQRLVAGLGARTPDLAMRRDDLLASGGDLDAFRRRVQDCADLHRASVKALNSVVYTCFAFPLSTVQAQLAALRGALSSSIAVPGVYALLANAFPEDLPAAMVGCDLGSPSIQHQLVPMLCLLQDPFTRGLFKAQLRIRPEVMIANLFRVYPPTCGSIADLLNPSQPPVRHMAAVCLARSAELLDQPTFERLLTYLEALPVADVDEELCRALEPLHGEHTAPQALLQREARLMIGWMQRSPSSVVRAGAAFFLNIHQLGEFRPIRHEILNAILAQLAVETDGQAREAMRSALQMILAVATPLNDYEMGGEQIQLGGCEDDHASLRDLDALLPALRVALSTIHAPARKPVAPEHRDF